MFYCVFLRCLAVLLAGWLAGWVPGNLAGVLQQDAGCRCQRCATCVPAMCQRSQREARGDSIPAIPATQHYEWPPVARQAAAQNVAAACESSVWKQPADRPPVDRPPVTFKNKQPGGRERGSQAKPGVNVAKNAWSWSWWWSWSRIWAEQAKEEEEAQREWLCGAGDSAAPRKAGHSLESPAARNERTKNQWVLHCSSCSAIVCCLLSIVYCLLLLFTIYEFFTIC